LHTSGTTSRPKLVGLTAENLMSSASAVAGTLQLSPIDRCLNVMPLFHIHGLVGVLLASVVAGASVEVVGGYDPFAYRRQLGNPDITWTSAVPRCIGRCWRDRATSCLCPAAAVAIQSRRRFLRACVRELRMRSPVPVVNAYGMTEACTR
jgi:acyl-CoA synthetase (AMP-forming)/AMP-acid ligase II